MIRCARPDYPTGAMMDELVAYLEIPRRTLYRDIEALKRAGFDIFSERDGRIAVWKLSPEDARLPRQRKPSARGEPGPPIRSKTRLKLEGNLKSFQVAADHLQAAEKKLSHIIKRKGLSAYRKDVAGQPTEIRQSAEREMKGIQGKLTEAKRKR